MTMNFPREDQKDFQAKKEGTHDHDPSYTKFSQIINTSTSRQWSTFKNPRIVRVSRAFGGKDRHSKVCTVRGLRDRRIRLSVPTAIQLYDLQDRLGLSQPSKVVDWLIEVTKHEIDKLPPLPIIPGINYPHDQPNIQENHHHEEGFEGFVSSTHHQVSAQNFFPISSSCQSSSMVPNFPYLQWDPPSLSLSQFGQGGGYYSFPNDQEESHSNLSLNSQLYLPSNILGPFSSQINTSMENIDLLRQINHLQNLQQNSILPTTLHLISSPMKSFGLNVNSKSVNSQDTENGTKTR